MRIAQYHSCTFSDAHCAISLHVLSQMRIAQYPLMYLPECALRNITTCTFQMRIAESEYLEGALIMGAGDAALNDGNPEVGGRQADISGRWFDGQAAVQGLCGHNPAGQAVRGQAVPESASQ
jgi:hypothetical protein